MNRRNDLLKTEITSKKNNHFRDEEMAKSKSISVINFI